MKLAQLFSNYSQLHWGQSAQSEVQSVNSDSRLVSDGDVFVAVKGLTVDGHKFLPDVCQKNVVAVVVEDKSLIPTEFEGAIVQVGDSKQALSQLCSRFYGDPCEALYAVGVTGTNGKTTTAHMVEAVLGEFNWPTGVIGTVDHHVGKHSWKSSLTTPGPEVFYKRLSEFVALDAKALCMEVSSMALDQSRLTGVPFNCAIFTNLTQDHLDYHENMQKYFQAKELLFSEVIGRSSKSPRFAIINKDDEYGGKINVADGCQVWYYGQSDCDFQFTVSSQSFSGSHVELMTPNGSCQFRLNTPGLYNVYNAVSAMAAGMAAGLSLDCCVRGIESFNGVSGRLQKIKSEIGLNVFVDYAHTPDALEKVLSGLREIRAINNSSGKIVCVFGCAGDRDKGKRPQMGKIAGELADIAVVTSDNPRSENPHAIIEDVVAGMVSATSEQVIKEADRKEAIHRAIQLLQPEDVLVIAGKGHEDYQELAEETIHFSDQEEVESVFRELEAKR